MGCVFSNNFPIIYVYIAIAIGQLNPCECKKNEIVDGSVASTRQLFVMQHNL